jgi:caprin-1
MPSVCKNSEKVNVLEAEQSLTPYKACISALDKKLRNLEKRKSKLDSYRDKLNKGEKLDKDQKEAVDKYESVIANLEFARELQKLYQGMSDEADKLAEKASKKQAKKEKLERQQQELDRLSDVLKLQSLMLSVGTDEVRADLLAGKYGGLTLTEQNLAQLDEFYQLISPTSDSDTSFTVQLSSATEHLVSYIDRADKQAVDTTTYRELHELIDRLSNAGFFEGSKGQESGNTAAKSSDQTETETGDESNTVTKLEETVDIGLRGDGQC